MKNVQLIVSKRAVSKVMKDFLVAVDKSCGGDGSLVSLHQDSQFAAVMYDESPELHEITYNLSQLLESDADYNTGLGVVAANMGKRASYMKGFSQIVRVLLHEFGHHMTYATIIGLYGEDEITRLYQEAKGSNEKYLHVPTEWVATQWAINWLADAENRKIAREFERKFWACFA